MAILWQKRWEKCVFSCLPPSRYSSASSSFCCHDGATMSSTDTSTHSTHDLCISKMQPGALNIYLKTLISWLSLTTWPDAQNWDRSWSRLFARLSSRTLSNWFWISVSHPCLQHMLLIAFIEKRVCSVSASSLCPLAHRLSYEERQTKNNKRSVQSQSSLIYRRVGSVLCEKLVISDKRNKTILMKRRPNASQMHFSGLQSVSLGNDFN